MNKFLIAWISVALFSISIGITRANKNTEKQIELQEFSVKLQAIELAGKYCSTEGSEFNIETKLWRCK